ncbi:DUF6538 domain-containing protein [uncultured Methylobacterium sp.]|uniref:DUF6538 domain-containing protein n=1 Tax=uncultured Methylobacterium sp. TaxID=157278 RepID=UPI0035CAEC58
MRPTPAIAHAQSRGATHSWHRRIPRSLCRSRKVDALIVSLGTRDPRRARLSAGHLTTRSRAPADADPDIRTGIDTARPAGSGAFGILRETVGA